MPLTREFSETVRERAQREPEFRRALLEKAVETLLSDDLELGKNLVRRYVNATLGFAALAAECGKNEKSLMHMLGPNGNPQARNLLRIIEILRNVDDFEIDVTVRKKTRAA